MNIHEETSREIKLASKLREIAVIRISQISLEEAAQKLGLAPGGVQALVWENSWSLECAFRTAECLDLKIMNEIYGVI